ncbi:hypothetical protein JXA88_10415 [Candidatus Fermentibacteria bacterium]|nr:hypothetical protein [Candidatus Fermentibacteria bacterium]
MSFWFRVASTVVCALLLAQPVPVFAAPTEDEAIRDWNDLHALREGLKEKVENIVPSYAPNIIGDEYERILPVLDDVTKKDIPGITKSLEAFSKRYGSSRSEIDDVFKSIVTFDWRSGKHPTETAGAIYEELAKWIANIRQARLDKAEALVREAEGVEQRISSFSSQVTEANFVELKDKLALALRFDPDNAKAKEWIGRVDKDMKKAMAGIQKAIDEARWPGHYKSFAGPGNPDKLAKSAMEWLQNDESFRTGKDPDHTFAVAVRGDWVSAKKNLLGQTIQWGLPIWAACHNQAEKKENVARVFSLTILTKEEAGIDKAPPWTTVWVGDIMRMRISNVPKMGGGRSSRGGLFGVLFRLALVIANIVVGLLLAVSYLKPKVPQLDAVYARILPLRNSLGVIALVLGIVAFLRALMFFFSPFADILPQLSIIVGGLFLGKEILLKKPAGVVPGEEPSSAQEKAAGAAAKAQEMLRTHEAQIDQIERHQVPLGIACIILGILHLFAGGGLLF